MSENRKIFLVGYSGCGKTSLGRKVAKRLGMRFVDTDAVIEEHEQASVSDIFRYEGEEYFRNVEREVVKKVASEDVATVISTGGGLPVWGDNAELLNELGTTVYIRRTAKQIVGRLSPYGRAKRPRFAGLDDAELIEFIGRDMIVREPFYAKARFVLDGDMFSDDELVDRLVKIYNGNEQ